MEGPHGSEMPPLSSTERVEIDQRLVENTRRAGSYAATVRSGRPMTS